MDGGILSASTLMRERTLPSCAKLTVACRLTDFILLT
jgi:hypothetical protein